MDLEERIMHAPLECSASDLVESVDHIDARVLIVLAMRPGPDFEDVMERFGAHHFVDEASFRTLCFSARYVDHCC